MLVDARSLPDQQHLEAAVCIVGAGAAGITLAREFAGSPFRVLLLESGGLAPDAAIQALYRGQNIGLPYHPLDATRLRYFGGTTNHWAGWCRPPSAADFRERPWMPSSGWPLSRDQLGPYLRRAHALCQLDGPFRYDAAYWRAPAYPVLPFASGNVKTVVTRFSPPTRFGKVYRDAATRAPNVTTVLHANVVGIRAMAHGKAVSHLDVATLTGKRFTVAARQFILATGGLENVRLLLVSNDVQKAGLGNDRDLVGRYFMDHVKFESGLFQPSPKAPALALYRRHTSNGARLKGHLGFSERVLRRERISPTYFELEPWHGRIDGTGRAVGQYLDDMYAPGPADGPATAHARGPQRVIVRIDPFPNHDSRVTLGSDRDALGLRRLQVDWRYTNNELRTFTRSRQLLARELGAAGLGRLHLTRYPDDAWPPPPGMVTATGFHHMGTTRMSRDPRSGVVDAHCRVHGVDNLYVAGSSVFPSYEGYPTMTIVALALRLAERIRQRLRP